MKLLLFSGEEENTLTIRYWYLIEKTGIETVLIYLNNTHNDAFVSIYEFPKCFNDDQSIKMAIRTQIQNVGNNCDC